MSDRETILRTIRQTQSRIRTNRILERLVLRLTIWVGVGLAVKFVDLVLPFAQGTIRSLWVVWFVGVAGLVTWSLRLGASPRDAATEVDRTAHLEDEVLSAWWFINNEKDVGPWINLHVHRTAEKVRKLDIGRLYPRVIPRMSLAAVGGLVLLVALHFVPLPFPAGQLFSGPRPPVDEMAEAESLMEEIEDLLERAEALDPDGTLEDFQGLMEALRDSEASLPTATSELSDLQSTLDEGNLSTAGILEGLEDMAEELMEAAATAAAGEALAEGNLQTGAAELDQLAQALAGAESSTEGLAEALERAAEDARPGLDALAESLGQAAQGLADQDNQAAGDALSDAADALRDLSDLVESQDLRNQASDRIDSLREALEGSSQGEPGEDQGSGEPGEGDQGEQSTAGEQQGTPGDSEAQPGQSGEGAQAGEGGEQAAGDSAPPGEAGIGQEASGQPGSVEGAAGGDTGMMPAGLGFSPEVKEGLATSLEVQLEQEATAAAAASEEEGLTLEPEEEASRQERSRLDYREVPSELTPAQQELLNQEQVPREYRNLIREYFQAIRPQTAP